MTSSFLRRRKTDFSGAVSGSLADGTCGVDLRGRFTFVDARAEKLFGWTEAELLGQDLHRVIHRCSSEFGTLGPGGKCPLWEASRSRVTFRCDTETVQRKDGATLSVMYTSSPLFFDERVVGTLFAFHDMTAREWEMVRLRESEQRYRWLVEASPDSMWLSDQYGYITLANQRAAETFGYTDVEDMLQSSSLEFIVPEDRPLAVQEKRKLTEPGMSSNAEYRLIRRDGTQFPAEISTSVLIDPDKKSRTFLSVARDITRHKQAEYNVRAGELTVSMEQAVTAALVSSTTLVETIPRLLETMCTRSNWDVGTFWSVDTADQVLRCRAIWHQPSINILRFEALSRQLAVASGIDLPGRVWSTRQPVWIPDVVADADILRALMASKEGLHAAFCFPIQAEGVVQGVMEFFSRETREPDLAMIEAITSTGNQIGRFLERRQTEQSLEYQASHDALTDLPNRALLQERLQRAVFVAHSGNKPLAVFLLDLDRFKQVNDTYGHHHGDLLLQQVAARLHTVLRDSDTVARVGGDEFAMLLPGTAEAGAVIVAKKILCTLQQPFVVEGRMLEIGGSIGIAMYPDHGEDAESLMHSADVAMYVAKRANGGYVIHTQDLDAQPLTPAAGRNEPDHEEPYDASEMRVDQTG
jgi:diguanylate cyclase (GGDEF)-like protein/PAS domain S-box-containing protein